MKRQPEGESASGTNSRNTSKLICDRSCFGHGSPILANDVKLIRSSALSLLEQSAREMAGRGGGHRRMEAVPWLSSYPLQFPTAMLPAGECVSSLCLRLEGGAESLWGNIEVSSGVSKTDCRESCMSSTIKLNPVANGVRLPS
jgi:hypothetical protein